MDAGMPIPLLVSSMQMLSYANIMLSPISFITDIRQVRKAHIRSTFRAAKKHKSDRDNEKRKKTKPKKHGKRQELE
jgi:hypothetical protein